MINVMETPTPSRATTKVCPEGTKDPAAANWGRVFGIRL